MRNILILGGLSAIAQAVARLHAARGDRLMLVARHEQRLAQTADDLRTRGAICFTALADLAAASDPATSLQSWGDTLGKIDVVYLFYGYLGDQKQAEAKLSEARHILETNYVSAAEWSLAAAALLERQRGGSLVVVSSVAGDRGRRSNYIYGSAKAGLSVLVQGIAHRLAGSEARAVVMKLGFVDTPMTDGLKKSGPLWAKPESVAEEIVAASSRGGPIQYAPRFWRWILLIIRSIPSPIFHRTNL